MQLTEYGDEWRDTRSARYKVTRPLVRNGTPYIPDDKLIAPRELVYLLCNTVMVCITFDRKFQVWLLVEAGKSKWPLFIFPSRFVHRHFSSLARYERIVFRLFDYKPLNIMSYLVYFQYPYYVIHI